MKNTKEDYEDALCECCGQTLFTVYTVSRGLRDSLKAMADFVERKGMNAAHIQKELVKSGCLKPNQAANLWTHGVYTGLVAHLDEPANYCITKKGFDFLAGASIPKHSFVSKKTKDKHTHVVGHSEETCTAKSLDKNTEYWEVSNYEVSEGAIQLPDVQEEIVIQIEPEKELGKENTVCPHGLPTFVMCPHCPH